MSTLDHAFFYNSNNGDRIYDADSFEYLLKKFFTTGVFTGSCAVRSYGSGMAVSVGAGYCNIDGKVRFFENDTSLTLTNAHATYNRIDTVVIERNDAERDITLKVINGVSAVSPTPRAPVRSNGVYQLVIAQIYVAAGAARITDGDITDKRMDSAVCGYVISAVQTPDFTEIFSQFNSQTATWTAERQAAFETWFDNVKSQLSTDAAGHLQGEIDTINQEMSANVMKTSSASLTQSKILQVAANLHQRMIEISIPAETTSLNIADNNITEQTELTFSGPGIELIRELKWKTEAGQIRLEIANALSEETTIYASTREVAR